MKFVNFEGGVMEKVIIKLKDWDYHCGDGCCYMYGTTIEVNGQQCDNEYAGGEVVTALEFVLNKIGIDHEIIIE